MEKLQDSSFYCWQRGDGLSCERQVPDRISVCFYILVESGWNVLKEHKLPAGIVYFCRALPSGQLEHIPCVTWRYLAAFWPSGGNSSWPAVAGCWHPRLGERGCGTGMQICDEQPAGTGPWLGQVWILNLAISVRCLSSLKYKYILCWQGC